MVECGFEGHKTTIREGHNVFGMQMARGTYEGTRKLLEGRRPLTITRATYSGGQRYSTIWTGDNFASDDHMPIVGWNESLIVYLLAASSTTHAISKSVYNSGFARNGTMKNGKTFYGVTLPLGEDNGGPLFFAHYSFLGLNPHNLSDVYANYWTQNTAHVDGNSLCRYDPAKNKFHPVIEGERPKSSITAVLPYDAKKTLLVTTHDGLFILEGSRCKRFESQANEFLIKANANRAIVTSDSVFVIGTILDGVVAVNKAGKILWKLNSTNFLQNNTILGIYCDRANNVWLALDKGIAFVRTGSRVKYVTSFQPSIGAVYGLDKYGSDIYIGTNQGLYAGKIGRLREDDKNVNVSLVSRIKGQVWDLKRFGNQLFCCNNEETYCLTGNSISIAAPVHVVTDPLYFVIDEKNNSVELTDKGLDLITGDSDDPKFFVLPNIAEQLSDLEHQNLNPEEKQSLKDDIIQNYSVKQERVHTIHQLLKAYTLFEKDDEYVVINGQVKIVDEQTGRIMEGRRYSDGLHQALEAKERVTIEAATQTFATITLQNYFRMYHKLAGMTGTAETEAGELWDIYKLDVMVIPTNRSIIRNDMNDRVYKTKREKYNAVIDEIVSLVSAGRPVLVGTTSVEISELLSRMLTLRKIPHNVLNAKLHQREAEIVAQAGQSGTVTIATNMWFLRFGLLYRQLPSSCQTPF